MTEKYREIITKEHKISSSFKDTINFCFPPKWSKWKQIHLLLEIDENQTKYVKPVVFKTVIREELWSLISMKKVRCTSGLSELYSIERIFRPNTERTYAEPEHSLRWWKQGVSNLKLEYNTGRGCIEREFQIVNTKSFSGIQPSTDVMYICVKSYFERLGKETHKRIN